MRSGADARRVGAEGSLLYQTAAGLNCFRCSLQAVRPRKGGKAAFMGSIFNIVASKVTGKVRVCGPGRGFPGSLAQGWYL